MCIIHVSRQPLTHFHIPTINKGGVGERFFAYSPLITISFSVVFLAFHWFEKC